jgi:putative ABC transport system permease protein
MMHSHDLRQAWRGLWKNPGFTCIAVLTLAVGIGANTAILSFVNALLLKPLPYPAPERLVMLFENHVTNGWHKTFVGAPIIGEWRRQASSFDGIAGFGGGDFILTGDGPPEHLKGSRVSANTFSLLGVGPILGRDFRPDEETYGNHHVILLSAEAWRRRFGENKNVVGRTLTINGDVCVVIGVMPANSIFPARDRDLWMPLAFSADDLQNRHAHNYNAFARLKPRVTVDQARAEMTSVAKRLEADEQNRGWGAEVYPLHESLFGEARPILLMLLGSVSFVLLIACANIANLLLARAASRSQEFGIRLALGASPFQIIRQLLTESVALASLGGLAGVLFAILFLKALIRFTDHDIARIVRTIDLDATTLLFTIVISLVAGVLFGLAPALQVSNPSLVSQINESGRGNSSSAERHRLRSTLVIGEVALSLILLVGSGLCIRSFGRLLSQDMGFNPEHLVSIPISVPRKSYPEHAEKERLFNSLLTQVRALPGVDSAALAYGLPLSGMDSMLYTRINDAPEPRPGEAVSAGYSQISAGYFKTLNIPILAGRDFTDRDRAESPAVVIVDQTFAKIFNLGTNIVGRRITIGDGATNAEIIGLVKDVKRSEINKPPKGEMYRAFRQNCWGTLTLTVRTKQDPSQLTRAIRHELDQIDKDVPFGEVSAVTQLVARSIATQRVSMQLLTLFAGAALFLATIGIYGVLACSVTQRTPEIGIRMALGAQRPDVIRLIINHGMRLVAVGLVIGLVGALAISRVLQTFLFEIKPFDPITFISVAMLLSMAALLACYLPARRATRVDPLRSLRHD